MVKLPGNSKTGDIMGQERKRPGPNPFQPFRPSSGSMFPPNNLTALTRGVRHRTPPTAPASARDRHGLLVEFEARKVEAAIVHGDQRHRGPS